MYVYVHGSVLSASLSLCYPNPNRLRRGKPSLVGGRGGEEGFDSEPGVGPSPLLEQARPQMMDIGKDP